MTRVKSCKRGFWEITKIEDLPLHDEFFFNVVLKAIKQKRLLQLLLREILNFLQSNTLT